MAHAVVAVFAAASRNLAVSATLIWPHVCSCIQSASVATAFCRFDSLQQIGQLLSVMSHVLVYRVAPT